MKLPRNLNGKTFADHLCAHWGFIIVHQSGSHIVMDTEKPSHQRISIPAHKPLRIGTLNAILRDVARHKGVEKADILGKLK